MRASTKEHSRSYYRDFGQRLRILREIRGFAEQDAAATAGVTLRTWRRWEAGCISAGNSRWVTRFAKKYDVSYGWLLLGKGPIAMSDYDAQMRELKALPPFVAEQMVFGNRPRLHIVK